MCIFHAPTDKWWGGLWLAPTHGKDYLTWKFGPAFRPFPVCPPLPHAALVGLLRVSSPLVFAPRSRAGTCPVWVTNPCERLLQVFLARAIPAASWREASEPGSLLALTSKQAVSPLALLLLGRRSRGRAGATRSERSRASPAGAREQRQGLRPGSLTRPHFRGTCCIPAPRPPAALCAAGSPQDGSRGTLTASQRPSSALLTCLLFGRGCFWGIGRPTWSLPPRDERRGST